MSTPSTTNAKSTESVEDDRKINFSEGKSGVDSAEVNGILQPGLLIRPMISIQVAAELVERLYGFQVSSINEMNSYDDRNFLVKIDPQSHKNPFVKDIWPHGYVLKVLNSMDSLKNHIDAEHEIQRTLALSGFNCPQPVLNIKGQDKSIEDLVYDLPIESDGKAFTKDYPHGHQESEEFRHGRHVVRLLTFVPGRILAEFTYTEQLLQSLGRYLASLQNALKGVSHPALEQHQSIWSLNSVPQLLQFVSAISDSENRKLIEEVIQAFIQEVVPKKDRFQRGVIHGDYNEQNILVGKISPPDEDPSSVQPGTKTLSGCDNEYEVCGILDFGDTSLSFYLYDVAMLIMYAMLDSEVVDFLDVGGHILAGYSSVDGRRLNEAEFDALSVCVAARYAQSLVLGAYSYSLNPTNEYLLTTAKNGWPQLRRLWGTPRDQVYERWRNVIEAQRI